MKTLKHSKHSSIHSLHTDLNPKIPGVNWCDICDVRVQMDNHVIGKEPFFVVNLPVTVPKRLYLIDASEKSTFFNNSSAFFSFLFKKIVFSSKFNFFSDMSSNNSDTETRKS